MTINGSTFSFILRIIISIILLYFVIVKRFIACFRADKTHQDNNITIQIENGHIKSIDIKMRETKYNEYYSIKNITELHRNNYIDVKGEIYAPDTECLSGDSESYKTDLRIPPYFDNMDEIYKELEKLKDQA